MTSAVLEPTAPNPGTNPPDLQRVPGTELKARGEQVALFLFIAVPLAALAAAVPLAWGRWISWTDVALMIVMYAISGHGITVGFHRYFTHGSFKANRGLRIGLAVAGSLAVQGPVIRWVADHRRHHKFSDADGDPHSPWRYGTSFGALTRGLWHAHVGWLFDVEQTRQDLFAPDLLKDRDVARVNRAFPLLVLASLLVPPLAGGLLTWSWQGALSAFFWAGLVRIAVLHHVTWSINSICHTIGEKPFQTDDKAGNVRALAVISMGESWHNLHHADPTSARHGVLPGQVDSSARLIRVFEQLGWARDVRWPKPERIAARRVTA